MQYLGLRFAVAVLTFVTGLTTASFIGNARLMPEFRFGRARCAERMRSYRRLQPPPSPPATTLRPEPAFRYEAPSAPYSPPPPRFGQTTPRDPANRDAPPAPPRAAR